MAALELTDFGRLAHPFSRFSDGLLVTAESSTKATPTRVDGSIFFPSSKSGCSVSALSSSSYLFVSADFELNVDLD